MPAYKILILGYHDFPYEGHGYRIWKDLLNTGYDATFLCYISKYTDDCPYYFIDAHKKYNFSWVYYRLKNEILQSGKKFEGKNEYCFFNPSNFFTGNAKRILRKIKFRPDVIVLTWCDFFISPRVLYDLYLNTNARIVISMVDPHVISGGCHFPCDCKLYESGCVTCPVLKNPLSAKELYEDKEKYLSKIPLTLVGTNYDLIRARKTRFLKDAKMKSVIHSPNVPSYINKREARQRLNLPEEDFIIMWGAQYATDKRKGFSFFIKALEIFSCAMMEDIGVSVLLLSNGKVDFGDVSFERKINFIQPGFYSEKELFDAFYAVDLYVSTSIDDSGPMMINFSMACGTPVLSFPVGVALDLIENYKTGFLTEGLSAEELAKGLVYFYMIGEEKKSIISKNCMHLMEKIREEYKPWYLSVIE